MKRNHAIAACLAALFSFILIVYSCSKKADRKTDTTNSSEVSKQRTKPGSSSSQARVDSCGSCNKYFQGTHAGTGNYVYPDIPLNLSCAVQNSTVTLGCVYYDVPNRYTIYDKNGNVVVTTGWIGWAHCPGPWGSSVTTSDAESFINFSYSSSLAPYKLRVETVVTGCNGCSTDPGCTDHDDNWQVHLMCITPSCPGGDCPEPPVCGSCGKYYQATHAGTGFYVYPDSTLDLTCAIAGSTVTVGCVYYDVPNRFSIYDKNGNVVVTTGWIGWAHCSGPWGFSITTSNAETFMNFSYSSSLAPYKLRIETTVIGCNGCSTDPGCTDHDDNWQAHILCVTH